VHDESTREDLDIPVNLLIPVMNLTQVVLEGFDANQFIDGILDSEGFSIGLEYSERIIGIGFNR